MWFPKSKALFNICVVDTDTQSYSDHTPLAVLTYIVLLSMRRSTHRLVKIRRKATFIRRKAAFINILLCMSISDMMGHKFATFLK